MKGVLFFALLCLSVIAVAAQVDATVLTFNDLNATLYDAPSLRDDCCGGPHWSSYWGRIDWRATFSDMTAVRNVNSGPEFFSSSLGNYQGDYYNDSIMDRFTFNTVQAVREPFTFFTFLILSSVLLGLTVYKWNRQLKNRLHLN